MRNAEKIFDYYAFFVYLFLIPFSLLLLILYFFFLDVEPVDDFFIFFGITGIILASISSIVCFVLIFNYLKKKNQILDFFKVFGAYLIFLPAFIIFSVGFTNSYFDKSDRENRVIEIVYKNENPRIRRGRKTDRFYIYAKSWKNNIDRVSIKVDRHSFQSLTIGDKIQVQTRNGFWNFEYIDFSE